MFADDKNIQIKYVDDFQFMEPVFFGDIMKFEATICCVVDDLAFVLVDCYKMNNDNTRASKANELHLVFQIPQNKKKVFPHSYGDSMKFINGNSYLNSHNDE
ncbi:hypothetical protein PPERSA_02469 [Pseudocohnilembus persalinus]|uniref:HotDog ACOT-type domain-containing protein n=1 Tax=Pseudocohnilembus persalinus TaxID=266149 RepID=A0A0V0QAT9_PSEPJ|nr:hypothetical protein PPERSA_02469 [Pseudocohnilembus persalinus]|eukprot:KRW99357.1 hypothetical protein PPERSA_02469 [Pseudocohnilembus persalinus]